MISIALNLEKGNADDVVAVQHAQGMTGQCRYCLDMVIFGGPSKKRQACILRKCSEMSAFKDLQSKQEGTSLKIPIKPVTATNIVIHNS